MRNRYPTNRLLSLWLALCLLALPMLAPAATGLPAQEHAAFQAPCEACDDARMDLSACAAGCVHAACVMAHCALFVPVARPVPPGSPSGLRPTVPVTAFYRSHLPGLPIRPPIA